MARTRQASAATGPAIGRDVLCDALMRDAEFDGAAILLGGPDAGKSTILRHIEWARGRRLGDVRHLPIYIDLKKKQPATAAECLRLFAARTREECAKRITGFDASAVELPSDKHPNDSSIELFYSDLKTIRKATGEVDWQPVFLIDDAEHIYRDEEECLKHFKSFLRFKRNIAEILFGERPAEIRCPAMIFAGTRKLYENLRHSGSNVLDREVATHHVDPLDEQSIFTLLQREALELAACNDGNAIAEMLWRHSGGHPGLLDSMIDSLVRESTQTLDQANEIVAPFPTRHAEALRNIYNSLSPSAKHLHRQLVTSYSLNDAGIISALDDGFDPISHAEPARQELCYTGIARYADGKLTRLGDSYWQFIERSSGMGSQPKRRSTQPKPNALGNMAATHIFVREGETWWLRYPRENRAEGMQDTRTFTHRLGLCYIQFVLRRYPNEVSYAELGRNFSGQGHSYAHTLKSEYAFEEGLSISGESETQISARVRKEIDRTIEKIIKEHADLGRHLRNYLKKRGGVLYLVPRDQKPGWLLDFPIA